MVVIGAELEDGPLPITDSKVDSIKAVSVKVGQGQGGHTRTRGNAPTGLLGTGGTLLLQWRTRRAISSLMGT